MKKTEDIMEEAKMIEEIGRIKKEKDAVIIAHNYMIPQVQDLADFTGDSLELSRKAAAAKEKIIVFCGVLFMAETAKILSPSKKVLIPRKDAGCPLADCINVQQVKEYREKYPDALIIGYVNTNADVKSMLDICVTSANAVDIVKKAPGKKVVFLPDANLGAWVKKHVPEKEIIIHKGGCNVHQRFTKNEILQARAAHPDAKILAHPEASMEVLELADFVASTSAMIKYVRESKDKKFIIGTEEGHIHRLKKERPDAEFFTLGSAKICPNMKKTRVKDVYESLLHEQYEIKLPDDIIKKAIVPIEKMLSM
jgi:quinolinate synthase